MRDCAEGGDVIAPFEGSCATARPRKWLQHPAYLMFWLQVGFEEEPFGQIWGRNKSDLDLGRVSSFLYWHVQELLSRSRRPTALIRRPSQLWVDQTCRQPRTLVPESRFTTFSPSFQWSMPFSCWSTCIYRSKSLGIVHNLLDLSP